MFGFLIIAAFAITLATFVLPPAVDSGADGIALLSLATILASALILSISSYRVGQEDLANAWVCRPLGMRVIQQNSTGVWCGGAGDATFVPRPTKE